MNLKKYLLDSLNLIKVKDIIVSIEPKYGLIFIKSIYSINDIPSFKAGISKTIKYNKLNKAPLCTFMECYFNSSSDCKSRFGIPECVRYEDLKLVSSYRCDDLPLIMLSKFRCYERKIN